MYLIIRVLLNFFCPPTPLKGANPGYYFKPHLWGFGANKHGVTEVSGKQILTGLQKRNLCF